MLFLKTKTNYNENNKKEHKKYDVSDPYYIKEIAYFIPPNPAEKYFEVEMPGPFLATTEDVVVDDRGYIYIDTFHDGM